MVSDEKFEQLSKLAQSYGVELLRDQNTNGLKIIKDGKIIRFFSPVVPVKYIVSFIKAIPEIYDWNK
jgi:hypothetical protein